LRFLGLCLLSVSLLTSCFADDDAGSEGVYAGTSLWTGWWTPGDTVDNAGYKPEQPIEFSHELHAGQKQIPCQYCHFGARRSASAVVPGLNTCMGCHLYVKTDSPRIQYITKLYKDKEPIRWVKVHDLPDHAHFVHSQHVKAGVDCASCHGQVEKMSEVQQVAPLQMGWCIDCHKENNARVNCSTCHY